VNFVAWLEFYDRVYQMEDPPPPAVIEDNEALDNFLNARRLKREGEERKSRLAASKDKGKKEHMKLL